MIRHRVVVVVALLGACSYESATPGPDAPAPPAVAFEFDKSGADEMIGTVKLPVVLSKPSDTPVTVNYSVLNGSGSATPTMDFAVSANQITFPPGVTRAEIPVDILPDFDDSEAAETFSIALADPVGATLDVLKAIHEVRIADHILPRIKWATTSIDTTDMETTATTLTIELTAPSEGESTVVLGVTGGATPADGDDFTLADATVVTFGNGMMSKTIDLGVIDDGRDEPGSETFSIQLKGASQNLVLAPNDTLATHTIVDDEATPVVQFDLATNTVDENVTTVTVTVSLNRESELPITVTLARNDGADTADAVDAVVGSLGTLTFAPHTLGVAGETVKTFDITIANDVFDEVSETVILTLTNPSNATLGTATHTLTINADATDPPPTVAFISPPSATVDEDAAGGFDIEVVLSVESGKIVTVDFAIDPASTATNGADYNLTPGTVTFMPGQVSKKIAVAVPANGTNSEPDETVIVNLTNPTQAILGTPAQFTLTIKE